MPPLLLPRSRVRKPRKPRERKPREKLEEDCNNYLNGKCRYGDNCRRQHNPVGIPQDPVEKTDEICRDFQAGVCPFGDMCSRQHVLVEA